MDILQTRKCKDKGRRQGEDEYSGSMTTGINKNVGEDHEGKGQTRGKDEDKERTRTGKGQGQGKDEDREGRGQGKNEDRVMTRTGKATKTLTLFSPIFKK